MALTFHPLFRRSLLMAVASLSLIWAETDRAVAEGAPDYVTEQFGQPPVVPEGPLPDTLRTAVKMAFVDSIEQQVWGRDQQIALQEVVAAGDPRVTGDVGSVLRCWMMWAFCPCRLI